jgi:hypothetical protein
MLGRRTFLAAAGALALPRAALAGGPGERPIPPLPISLAVAEVDGAPVRDAAWVDAELAHALYAPLGISLRRVASRALPAARARIETRADRDALASIVEPRRVNVLSSPPSATSTIRRSTAWASTGAPARIRRATTPSSRRTRAITLAHELGHFFGLDHTKVVNNVMSYASDGGPPFFDDRQAARVRAMARMYVEAKPLEPAGPAEAGETPSAT